MATPTLRPSRSRRRTRYQAASGRQIDPGVVALVTAGDVHSATAERRVREVEAELRSSRDVAAVSSYYDSHDSAMVARDGRATYVVAYFRPKSDLRIQDDATRLESEFAGQRDVELGGGAIADAQVNTQVGNDLARAELFAFPIIFLLSLLFFRSLVASLLPPLLGGLAILLTFFALRIVSSFTDLSVFASKHRHRPRARPRDRLQPVHGLPLPRGGRSDRLRRRRSSPDGRYLGPDDRVQLGDGRGGARLARRSSRRTSSSRWGSQAPSSRSSPPRSRSSCCRRCSRCSGHASTPSRPSGSSAPPTGTRNPPKRASGTGCHGS